MKSLIKIENYSEYLKGSKENSAFPFPAENNNNFQDGIPLMKLREVNETIDLYKKLIAISVLANSIIATIGVIYL